MWLLGLPSYLIWVWEFSGCFLGMIAPNRSSPGSPEDQRPNSLQVQLNRHAKEGPDERLPHALGGMSIMDAALNFTCYCPPATWSSQTAPTWSYNIPQWAVPHKDCPVLLLRLTRDAHNPRRLHRGPWRRARASIGDVSISGL